MSKHRAVLHSFDAMPAVVVEDHLELFASCCRFDDGVTPSPSRIRAAIQAGDVDCDRLTKAITAALAPRTIQSPADPPPQTPNHTTPPDPPGDSL